MTRLYKRDSGGNVRVWWMEVDGGRYRTCSGVDGGSIVESNWTCAEGKNVGRSNETSPEQQALLEVGSKYTKKREQEHYTEDPDSSAPKLFFEPMLAQKYEGRRKAEVLASLPVYAQPKLDGIRCVTHEGVMKSRKGKPFMTVGFLVEELAGFFDRHPSVTLDGELYNHDYRNDFNTLTSVIKTQKPKPEDIERTRGIVQYHIYDCFDDENPGMPFSERNAFLARELPASQAVVVVRTDACESESCLDALNKEYVSQGYEGQMIRINGPYEFEKRSRYLLKRKDFEDAEYEIVRVEEGRGNRSGMAGRITYRLSDGREFGSGIRGGFTFYKRLWDDRDSLVGKQGTVRYQELTPDGVPRFPVTVAIRDYE